MATATDFKDYYATLGVPTTATPGEIRRYASRSAPTEECDYLVHQLQDPSPTDPQSLQQKIEIGAQQLLNGEYTEYTDETLPELLGKIRSLMNDINKWRSIAVAIIDKIRLRDEAVIAIVGLAYRR